VINSNLQHILHRFQVMADHVKVLLATVVRFLTASLGVINVHQHAVDNFSLELKTKNPAERPGQSGLQTWV